jgi:acetolactate synthase I/II/III large subunit
VASYPDRTAICFVGDGDFWMTRQELCTAMQAGTQPVTLILSIGNDGTTRAQKEHHDPTRVSGTDLQNLDVTLLARAYGYCAERADRTGDFPVAFARVLTSHTEVVLDINT